MEILRIQREGGAGGAAEKVRLWSPRSAAMYISTPSWQTFMMTTIANSIVNMNMFYPGTETETDNNKARIGSDLKPSESMYE